MNNREIDKLVAEKVMEWDFNEESESWITEFGYCFFSNGDDNEWSPSSDIQDAWLVVKKMRKVSDILYGFEIEDGFDKEYKCCFYGMGRAYTDEADTAPMAICLAALKTVGISI